jgi:hypothetical protein
MRLILIAKMNWKVPLLNFTDGGIITQIIKVSVLAMFIKDGRSKQI